MNHLRPVTTGPMIGASASELIEHVEREMSSLGLKMAALRHGRKADLHLLVMILGIVRERVEEMEEALRRPTMRECAAATWFGRFKRWWAIQHEEDASWN
jgi:hypothetical protein